MGRTVADQVSHWARLGRAVEAAGARTTAIHEVLDGQGRFDDLDSEDQAAVAEMWGHRVSELLGDLDLRSEFETNEQAYAELDEVGNVVTVDRRSERQVREPARRQGAKRSAAESATAAKGSVAKKSSAKRSVAKSGSGAKKSSVKNKVTI